MSKCGMPLVRLVNTKRITLNFEVKDVGPSGLSSVELWYTQDGKDWKKYDAPTQAKAYVVEVDEEGMYGFTLLARSGTGLAQGAAAAGRPAAGVGDRRSEQARRAADRGDAQPEDAASRWSSIKWKASDKNLGRQPITLSYAEKEEGPWKVIAAGLENAGTYNWEVPKGTPARVLFRVEATDLAGNVGRAQSSKAGADGQLAAVGVDRQRRGQRRLGEQVSKRATARTPPPPQGAGGVRRFDVARVALAGAGTPTSPPAIRHRRSAPGCRTASTRARSPSGPAPPRGR